MVLSSSVSSPLTKKIDLFLQVVSDITNQAGEFPEHRINRHHPRTQAGSLQFFGNKAETRCGLAERLRQILHLQAPHAELPAELEQAVAFQHKLADKIDEFVQLAHIHAHSQGNHAVCLSLLPG